MTDEEITKWRKKISVLTREEMARLWRHAPAGHLIFTTPPLFAYFEQRFKSLGGMTPEISKKIGW